MGTRDENMQHNRIQLPVKYQQEQKSQRKARNYGPLVRNLQIMYPEYKCEVAPIVIGAMRYVPKCLINYLKMIEFNENGSKVLITKLEIKSISGTVKNSKTFLNFNDPFHNFNFTRFLHEATFQIFIWYKTSNLDALSL